MTPARKRALQWVHDQGEAQWFPIGDKNAPSRAMRKRMVRDGQLTSYAKAPDLIVWWRLTDKGRRDLHEATR